MDKIGIILWSGLFLFSLTTVTWAQSELPPISEINTDPLWELSLAEWDLKGWFNYLLYYPNRTQMLSRVSFPQNQLMPILNLKYTLPGNRFFVRLQYGQAAAGTKGRGFDGDWTIPDRETLTFYGDFDAYGSQSIGTFDVGRILSGHGLQRTSAFLGLIRQITTNELKNGVYHRYFGVAVGGQPQADLGSTLDGKFQGVRLGIEREQHWSRWLCTGTVGLTILETKAYGHWANHDPAWDWVNSGYTVGVTAGLSLQYAVTRNVVAQLGYYLNYAQNYFYLLACDELITGAGFSPEGEWYPDQVILNYKQQGIRGGIKVLF